MLRACDRMSYLRQPRAALRADARWRRGFNQAWLPPLPAPL